MKIFLFKTQITLHQEKILENRRSLHRDCRLPKSIGKPETMLSMPHPEEFGLCFVLTVADTFHENYQDFP